MAASHLVLCIMTISLIVSSSFGTPLHRRLKRYSHIQVLPDPYRSPAAPNRRVQAFDPVYNFNRPGLFNPSFPLNQNPVPVQPQAAVPTPTTTTPAPTTVQSAPAAPMQPVPMTAPMQPVPMTAPMQFVTNGNPRMATAAELASLYQTQLLPAVLDPNAFNGNPGGILLNPSNFQTVNPGSVIIQVPQMAPAQGNVPNTPVNDDNGLNLATLLAILAELFPDLMIPTLPPTINNGGSSEAFFGGGSSR